MKLDVLITKKYVNIISNCFYPIFASSNIFYDLLIFKEVLIPLIQSTSTIKEKNDLHKPTSWLFKEEDFIYTIIRLNIYNI